MTTFSTQLPLGLNLSGIFLILLYDQSIFGIKVEVSKFFSVVVYFQKALFMNNIFRRRFDSEHSLHVPMFKS